MPISEFWGNYWRKIIFFTVPLSKIIFKPISEQGNFFRKKPKPPPRISNGPCLNGLHLLIEIRNSTRLSDKTLILIHWSINMLILLFDMILFWISTSICKLRRELQLTLFPSLTISKMSLYGKIAKANSKANVEGYWNQIYAWITLVYPKVKNSNLRPLYYVRSQVQKCPLSTKPHALH